MLLTRVIFHRIVIFAVFLSLSIVSCAGTPKSGETPPAAEEPSAGSAAVQEVEQESEEAIFDEDFLVLDETEDEEFEADDYVPDSIDAEGFEDFEPEEPFTWEYIIDEDVPEDASIEDEEPLPIEEPTPEPVVSVPPSVPSAPPPAPAAPPAPLPPAPVTPPPAPQSPPPVTPAAPPPAAPVTPPPVAEEAQPPVIVRDPDYSDLGEVSIPTPAFTGLDDRIIFSRSVQAMVGQMVEVPYRGTGWVYLGEAEGRRGIVYDSRRLDPEGQSFVFRTETPGIYTLRFYRQDFIRDIIINDNVQVTVVEAPEAAGPGRPSVDRGRVIAEPRWPSTIEEALRQDRVRPLPPDTTPPAAAPSAPSIPPAAPPTPVPVQPPPVPTAPSDDVQPASPPIPAEEPPPPASLAPVVEMPADSPPDAYLKRAQDEFDAGNIAAAIAYLDLFTQRFPAGSDEALWLYGQCYEANSPSRNILASLEYYRRLVDEYPQSSRAPEARRRIAYLQRYYINIQ